MNDEVCVVIRPPEHAREIMLRWAATKVPDDLVVDYRQNEEDVWTPALFWPESTETRTQ